MESGGNIGQFVTEKDNRLLDRNPHFCGTNSRVAMLLRFRAEAIDAGTQ